MEHYVTLFDSLFLPQGLALHFSMERHVKNYKLWILCVDERAYVALTSLQLANVELLRLSELETQALLDVKSRRNAGEYCWTLTPFAVRFVFEADKTVERVTYLDADVWFRKAPDPIFKEFEDSSKHVLITDHAYAPEHDQSESAGQYCVQFMTFTRTGGELVRQWWEDRCVEWCYARVEGNKFGDQKYLDDWPIRFENRVHVLLNKELILAPWNAFRFPYGNSIVWHFQGLRIAVYRHYFSLQLSHYPLPETTQKSVYQPYIRDISEAIDRLSKCGFRINSQAKNTTWLLQLRYKLSPWFSELKKINRPKSIKIKLSKS